MSKRFIKLYPSEELQWLIVNHGNAFVLLSLIAIRARRFNGHPDGLIIGDALIGSDDLQPGMSRQNFRTAINKLVEFNYIEIISNGKKFLKREKSTIKVTIKGMLVNLLNSSIYDINSEDANQQTNQRPTNGQPTANHKQERIRKNKKEKEEKQPLTPSFEKIQFRENVLLTQEQYDSLLAKHGQFFFDRMLNALDSYKGSSGKIYKSDFHTMKDGGWVIDRVKKDMLKPEVKNEKAFGSPSEATKSGEPRFQPSRVIRGSNDVEGN